MAWIARLVADKPIQYHRCIDALFATVSSCSHNSRRFSRMVAHDSADGVEVQVLVGVGQRSSNEDRVADDDQCLFRME